MEIFIKFTDIMNKERDLRKEFSKEKSIHKILRAPTSDWNSKLNVIAETHNLSAMLLENLYMESYNKWAKTYGAQETYKERNYGKSNDSQSEKGKKKLSWAEVLRSRYSFKGFLTFFGSKEGQSFLRVKWKQSNNKLSRKNKLEFFWFWHSCYLP